MPQKKTSKKKAQASTKASLRGRGDYTVEDREMLKSISQRIPDLRLSQIGKKAGALVGMGQTGERVGSAMEKLFGFGDYDVKVNSLMHAGSSMQANHVPYFSKSGKRGVRVTEREYIGDIVSGGTLVSGSTSFDIRTFRINPGDSAAFPWLSYIAAEFDQWEPQGIVFEFVSTSSEYNGTSQALGTVVMATEYDPNDPAYATKVEMENADFANSTKPSMTAMHGIECDPSERPTDTLYCGTAIPNQEKFYDLGKFSIATQGMSAANVTLGELWVSYDIVFYKKQIPKFLLSNYAVFATNVTSGQFWFPSSFTTTPGSSSLFTGNGVSGIVTLPPNSVGSSFLVVHTATWPAATNSTTTGMVFSTTNLQLNSVNSSYGTGGGRQTYQWVYTVTGPAPTIRYTNALQNLTSCVYSIFQVNPEMAAAGVII